MGERVEKFEAGSVTGSALNRSAFSPALSSREGNVSLSLSLSLSLGLVFR